MTFLQAFILLNLKKIKGARTAYSIFHLLKGKKSSQTIQDAHFFKMGEFFQTYPFLQRHLFDELIDDLTKKNLICQKEHKKYLLTNQGEEALSSFFQRHSFPNYLNGLKYQDIAILFWKRINLIIQVLSNAIYEIKTYYPIQRDEEIQNWLKYFLKKQNHSKLELSTTLFNELNSLLLRDAPENPEIFVIRLTGKGQIGKTIDQAAQDLLMEHSEYWFRFAHLLHFMIETIIMNKNKYVLLYSIISDTYRSMPLTKSTKETLFLLRKGHSISEVAYLRKLKESTIEDHIIEIVLNDHSFDISPFLEKEVEQAIISTAESISQKKLKPIKELIGHVSYFQIRLALAKQGEWE